MISAFGEQPVKGILSDRGITVAGLARATDINTDHLRGAVVGRVRPSQDVRVMLCAVLNEPITRLFTPEVLEIHYEARANARGHAS